MTDTPDDLRKRIENLERTIRLLLKLHEAHHNEPMHSAARAALRGE